MPLYLPLSVSFPCHTITPVITFLSLLRFSLTPLILSHSIHSLPLLPLYSFSRHSHVNNLIILGFRTGRAYRVTFRPIPRTIKIELGEKIKETPILHNNVCSFLPWFHSVLSYCLEWPSIFQFPFWFNSVLGFTSLSTLLHGLLQLKWLSLDIE